MPYDLNAGIINNTSVVFMLTLGGKKMLFLGDAEPEEGERLLTLYKGTDKLKADYVQMAHHGQGGVEREVYEEISPKACFWCAPGWLWDNDAGGGFTTTSSRPSPSAAGWRSWAFTSTLSSRTAPKSWSCKGREGERAGVPPLHPA
jgi:hypothetical protein